jgi:hypothetical protein
MTPRIIPWVASLILIGGCRISPSEGTGPASADKQQSQTTESEKLRAEVFSLVAKLGDDKFDERETAQKRLEAMPGMALAVVKAAVDQATDPEVRHRGEKVIRFMEEGLPFEPFEDVVCRVEAESAEITVKPMKGREKEPLAVRVEPAGELRPWRGMGVSGPPELDKYDLLFQKWVSGGKVLWVDCCAVESSHIPFLKIKFNVPTDGDYYVFIKAVSWCCGCQFLVFRMDGGNEQRLERDGWPIWQGYWQWQPFHVKNWSTNEDNLLVGNPERVKLSAGEHTLELISLGPHEVAIDEIAVARRVKPVKK